jgi:hypothetical protein
MLLEKRGKRQYEEQRLAIVQVFASRASCFSDSFDIAMRVAAVRAVGFGRIGMQECVQGRL